jgi:hypothetical protein
MKKILLVLISIAFIKFSPAQSNETNTPIDSLLTNGRCLPSPFPSPPFPLSDYAGGPVIGAPISVPDYLTQAIQKARKKPWTRWNKVGIKIYGWVDVGVNGSTSRQTNSPASYDLIPNRPVLESGRAHDREGP